MDQTTFQDVSAMSKKMFNYASYAIDGCKGLLLTIKTMRPDQTAKQKTAVNSIKITWREHHALRVLVKNVTDSMTEVKASPQAGMAMLQELWTYAEDRLNKVKVKVVKAVFNMIQAELDYLLLIQEQIQAFMRWSHYEYRKSSEDVHKADELSELAIHLRNWTNVCQLFLETKPEHMTPGNFFTCANAFYLALSKFYESIIVAGDLQLDITYHLFLLAKDFVRLGAMGPSVKSLLQLTNEFEHREWLRKTLRWNGRSPLTDTQQTKSDLVKSLKIDEAMISLRSMNIYSKLFRSVPINFFRPYYIVKLFDDFLRKAIVTAKWTYTQMKRTIFHTLSLAFPPKKMIGKVYEVLLDMSNYFSNCFEVLRMCKSSIEDAKKYQIASIMYNLSNLRRNEACHSVLGMGNPYVDDCKQAVRKIVNDDYAMSKGVIYTAMLEFVYNTSSKIAEIGVHPLQLNSTYARFREAMSAYQGIMSELQDVGTLDGSTWLMAAGQGMDEAKAELILRFNKCYESLKGLKGRWQPTNWGFVLQRLPVTEGLKEEIHKLSEVPFSREPKTYRTILPPPATPDYLQVKVFDLKNVHVDEEDIVTNEKFQARLKGHTHEFKTYQPF